MRGVRDARAHRRLALGLMLLSLSFVVCDGLTPLVCFDDQECETGQICVDSQCRTPCLAESDCLGGDGTEECLPNGLCATAYGCGDGIATGTEPCDGEDLRAEDCTTQGFEGGTLACAGDCSAFDTSACAGDICGNDIATGAEVCDGADLAGEDCASLGSGEGTLACLPDCTDFDTSGCRVAGACDGICGGFNGLEDCGCDDACESFGDCCPDVCSDCPELSFCAPDTCGDGVINATEECEPGNPANPCTTECLSNCECRIEGCDFNHCEQGPAPPSACNECVARVCDADLGCCEGGVGWDFVCTALANDLCGDEFGFCLHPGTYAGTAGIYDLGAALQDSGSYTWTWELDAYNGWATDVTEDFVFATGSGSWLCVDAAPPRASCPGGARYDTGQVTNVQLEYTEGVSEGCIGISSCVEPCNALCGALENPVFPQCESDGTCTCGCFTTEVLSAPPDEAHGSGCANVVFTLSTAVGTDGEPCTPDDVTTGFPREVGLNLTTGGATVVVNGANVTDLAGVPADPVTLFVEPPLVPNFNGTWVTVAQVPAEMREATGLFWITVTGVTGVAPPP